MSQKHKKNEIYILESIIKLIKMDLVTMVHSSVITLNLNIII